MTTPSPPAGGDAELIARLDRYSNPNHTYGLDDYRSSCRDAADRLSALIELAEARTVPEPASKALSASTFDELIQHIGGKNA